MTQLKELQNCSVWVSPQFPEYHSVKQSQESNPKIPSSRPHQPLRLVELHDPSTWEDMAMITRVPMLLNDNDFITFRGYLALVRFCEGVLLSRVALYWHTVIRRGGVG